MDARTSHHPVVANSGGGADHPLALIFAEAKQKSRLGEFDAVEELLRGFTERLSTASESFVHGTQPQQPVASIVVLSHRPNKHLRAALESIAQQCPAQSWEIVLVHNGNDSLFETAKQILPAFVGVRLPFPVGCPSGRNLGAGIARSDIVLFLDDDGIMEPDCSQSLYKCLTETGSVAVRGRVVPLSGSGPAHYDLGDERIPSFIDCEGVSAWRRSAFLEKGGFHPLLDGHEGIDLCARLWRHYGPLAFIYEPSAVLRHNYATDTDPAAKARRYTANRSLAEASGEHPFDIHRQLRQIGKKGRHLYLAASGVRSPIPAGGAPVSIVTTAHNGAAFIEEFTACWKRQTQREFQLVFVDDGSTDGTAELVKEMWSGDERLILIQQEHKGRGSALNTGFAAATHDICLIADADDLSIPSRIARTANFFASNPDCAFLSFVAFNELDLFRIGSPPSPFVSDMDIRSLFHMPASFPTFACRKSRFPEAFDEILRGGIDCDWLHRNMQAAGVKGRLVHYPAVYYRRHEGQITRRYNHIQWEARERLMHYAFGRILGELKEDDKTFIKILVDVRSAPAVERRRLGAWVMRLLRENDRLAAYDPELLGPVLLQAFDSVKEIPTVDEKIRSLRLEAERMIAVGSYKQARTALRKALRMKDDPEIQSRIRAAHRLRIVRAFSNSRPFEG